MAATDPTKLASSAQIFSSNYSLPQIRAIHKTLHGEIEDKAARLRTQVGSSYRDLLGTADTIVQMRAHSDAVQDLLGTLGWRCGREAVAAKTGGLARFGAGKGVGSADVAEAARRRLLDGCFLAVGRILKGRGQVEGGTAAGNRLVLAAKVWLLSRLLVKNFKSSDNGEEEGRQEGGGEEEDRRRRATEAEDRKTLDGLRRRLRRALEKTLARVSEDHDRDDILKALCAHSLVNSSGAKDGLRFFLEVRSKAMAAALDDDEEGTDDKKNEAKGIISAFRLYTRTLLDAQALVPGKLSLALHALKEHPLLRDKSLQQLEGLRLDVCERWCSEEIRYFTPYIRHDDLDGALAKEVLASWATKGRETLLDSFTKTLAEMMDFKSILELRTSVLQLWIRESGKIKGLGPLEMQGRLRQVINSRMLAVLENKVSRLELVGAEIRDTLKHWQDGNTGKVANLWDEEGYDEALSRGAAPFIREVASRFFGRGESVSRAVDCYAAWFQVIGVVEDVVETLKKQRWDNDYEEIEDEETIEARQQLLSREDPKMLQEKLDTALDQAFHALEDEIKALWEQEGPSAEGARNGQVAMFLLRVLRDIRTQLPKREAMKSFGLAMVPALHRTIAAYVSDPPVSLFTAKRRLDGQILGGRVLWEGDPAVPNQPSSQVFQFMRDLAAGMADAGVDLWTAAAVRALKERVSGELCGAWEAELAEAKKMKQEEEQVEQARDEREGQDEKGEKAEETEENNKEAEAKQEEEGNEGAGKQGETKEKERKERDMFIQWLFDVAFLRCSIGGGSAGAANGLERLEEAIFKNTVLQEPSRQRISKSARSFWERTSLLFGVLA
ncbi:hypothetical protein ESCO_001363 [Escovopsis weberi]|uniref:Conserved oligomeric Golgi complex subunit 1 n=1 Tax=Escovopsis weberi TaxID=150374 RepID=A0A0M8N3E4_ESCWE|nr:hypothetical protein ESCO_001363 [Escovopsis weberi]